MRPLTNIYSEIEKIRNNESSFLGIDGGNIKSKIWFCGVEFGATLTEMENYYFNYASSYQVENLQIPYRIDCPEKLLKSFFDRALALMYSIIFDNSDHLDKTRIDIILKNELYNKVSKIFKLNLFPLAKTDIGWNKDFENKFNITKDEYYDLLFENRKSFLKEIVKQFSPKTIICFSPKEYSDLFIDVFFENKISINYEKDFIVLNNGKRANIKILYSNNLKVIIIPFLGRGNLNSYDNVILMTYYLKMNYL
jgi:hypothetical protein